MKIRTRITAFLLSMILILSVLPLGVMASDVYSGSCGEKVKWNYNADTKTLTISGSGKMDDYDHEWLEKVVPWYDYCYEIFCKKPQNLV